MIHETLLYMLHNSINNSGGEEPFSWNVFELQEFLHPGEKKLIQNIVDIDFDYHWIVAFIRNVHNQGNQGNNISGDLAAVPHGLYIKAFTKGVDKVLEDYRNEIIKLEMMFLNNPQLPLAFTLYALEKYRGLFQALKTILQLIDKNNSYSCLLMEKLHKYVNCGVDLISLAATKILQSVNVIFYRHLCNWIFYGYLDDDYNEFFIVDGKCADEDFLYPEQIVAIENNSTSEFFKKSRIKFPALVRNFSINWSLVPGFINEDIAESILFMGRIVWILKNGPKKPDDGLYKRDIWDGKEVEYYQKVQALENETFNQIQFESTVEECRIKLTKYLWGVMLDEGNLKEHLYLIRDYYTMERSALFQQFITVAENHLKNVASEQFVQNLNSIFMESGRKIFGENDKTYQRFEFATTATKMQHLWSQLQMNFEIKWPLHIIFHPKSMELYNKLFCYLLRLKRTQINLQKLCKHTIKMRKLNRKMWVLRQHLIFLVYNLQYYLQIDVIEAEFSVMLKAIENANEFENIVRVHHEFLTNVLSKSFLLAPDEKSIQKNKHKLHQIPAVQFDACSKIYTVIISLLDLCDKFCLLATTWEETLTEPELMDLEKYQQQTDTIVKALLMLLHSLHKKAKGQHLLQLLHQLDFNGFFTKTKPDFNLSIKVI